jgi:hypothetical protein
MEPEKWQKNGEHNAQTLREIYASKHNKISNLWRSGSYESKP